MLSSVCTRVGFDMIWHWWGVKLHWHPHNPKRRALSVGNLLSQKLFDFHVWISAMGRCLFCLQSWASPPLPFCYPQRHVSEYVQELGGPLQIGPAWDWLVLHVFNRRLRLDEWYRWCGYALPCSSLRTWNVFQIKWHIRHCGHRVRIETCDHGHYFAHRSSLQFSWKLCGNLYNGPLTLFCGGDTCVGLILLILKTRTVILALWQIVKYGSFDTFMFVWQVWRLKPRLHPVLPLNKLITQT